MNKDYFAHTLETDVVIVGGGVAGLNAALGATENGASVLVLDKGTIERSGSIAGGIDHFLAFLEEGEPWDSEQSYLEYASRIGRGAVNIKVHESIYCREVKAAINRMADIGVPLCDEKGVFKRTKSFGQPGPYWINFLNGAELKPKLAKEVRRRGTEVLDRVMTTKLFLHDGLPVGVTGFHVRSGEFFYVRCKAAIFATGPTIRLFTSPIGRDFDTWWFPSNTGDSQSIAYRAGVTLANMEYVAMTIVPKGFSAPGLNAFGGMGCTFINRFGERYMLKYDPAGDRAQRYRIIEATIKELAAGNGPVSIDCRHLEPESLEHLKKTLGCDKNTLPDFLAQKSIDLANTPLEIMVSAAHQSGVTDVFGSGISIDEKCQSTIPGIFACGDCSDQSIGLHLATTSGYVAGREAARYAIAQKASPESASVEEINEEINRVFLPLNKTAGIPHQEFTKHLGDLMWRYVGVQRTGQGLKQGLAAISNLSGDIQNLAAGDLHELMRVHEAANLITVAELTASAALFRRESRFQPCHFREDYPETDENWTGQVLVKNEGGRPMTTFKKLEYSC